MTDDFTKIYGNHSFKMGIEYQYVKFSTLQPAWSHGAVRLQRHICRYSKRGNTTGGIAQVLLPPTAAPATIDGAPNPNGFSYSGGTDFVYASNINKTYDQKMYFASYFQDDWKVTPKLTINLGLRWDNFGPINETNGGQANFVPYAIPGKNIGARNVHHSRHREGQSDAVHRTSGIHQLWRHLGFRSRRDLPGSRLFRSPGPSWPKTASRWM